MLLRLPPLESLRYFEAAARHLSFTLAAEELCISQSAISQKIIQLEKRLGYKLFERHTRQLSLTKQGSILYPAVYASLTEIRDTLNQIESDGQMTKLTVYCLPSFASHWLMPRLHDFHIKHPQIDLDLVAELSEPNFHNEVVDIGICHGVGDQHDMDHTFLFWDYIYPVISPELSQSLCLKELQDLDHKVLLHDSLPQAKLSTSWQRWALERGVRNVDFSNGYRFNQVDLIVRAALDGRGVALGRHVLVAKYIKEGRLQPLFDDYERNDGVYVVCLKKSINRPQVAAFLEWIREEASKFDKEMAVEKWFS